MKRLNSVRGLSQFYINKEGKRPVKITLIGELHNNIFECKGGDDISVFEYCKIRNSQNKKCKFLLEYPPGYTGDFNVIGSDVIQDIFTREENDVRLNSIGIDIRHNFLSCHGVNKLYHGSMTDSELERIKNIDKKKLFDIAGKPRTRELENYIIMLIDKFDMCNSLIDVKWAWSMVTDYNILNIIFSDTSVDEYIIVVGNNHRKNIRNTLKNIKYCEHIYESSENDESNCAIISVK